MTGEDASRGFGSSAMRLRAGRPQTITIKVALPRTLAARLARVALRRSVPPSAVVREALEARLRAEPRASRASCFDIAPDLAGAVRAPKGLAGNRRWLRGYGRRRSAGTAGLTRSS